MRTAPRDPELLLGETRIGSLHIDRDLRLRLWYAVGMASVRRRLARRVRGLRSEAGTFVRWARSAHRTPRVRFVVFGSGRSGTTLLAELLNCHPEIVCERELLHHPLVAPRAHVDRRCALAAKPVYGFKLLIRHLLEVQSLKEPTGFVRRLHEDGYRILHVQRMNPLRKALSYIVAHRRQIWFAPQGAERAPVALEVRMPDLDRWLARLERWSAAEQEALRGLPHLSIVYEDDLLRSESHQATLDRSCAWLGVPSAACKASLTRIAPDRIRDLVLNYDELAAHLAGTPYERVLDE